MANRVLQEKVRITTIAVAMLRPTATTIVAVLPRIRLIIAVATVAAIVNLQSIGHSHGSNTTILMIIVMVIALVAVMSQITQ